MNAPSDPRAHRRLALEQIALDSVGALSTSDTESWVREHLDDGCAVCVEASTRVSELFDQLLLAAPPVTPPRELRARVLAAVRNGGRAGERAAPPSDDIQVWNRWTTTDASKFYTLSSSDGDWQDTAIPGIAVRQLHIDEQRDAVTMLVRMSAGTAYPRHRHAGDEQCYVLEGDLEVEDQKLRAGDYQFAPSGSIHGVQSTRQGCTLLIVSSRHDEILAG